MTTILVVDDEPKIARLVRDYMEASGFRAVMAHDGKTALAQFRYERPDLVVLDLNLPGMDGIDVARAIRQERNTPIIMLTARVEETDRIVGLELGADDYVTKPFSPASWWPACAPCFAARRAARRARTLPPHGSRPEI